MGADGAFGGRVAADIDKPAVAALPDLLMLTRKDFAGLNAGGESLVALLVVLLDGGNLLEQGGDVGKALLLCLGGHPRVHGGMLLVFTGGGHPQTGQCVRDLAVLHQQLKPDFGVRTLIIGGVIKDRTDLLVTFLPRLGGKEGVFVAGLTLACKSLPQVFLGLAASEFHTDTSSLNKNQS